MGMPKPIGFEELTEQFFQTTFSTLTDSMKNIPGSIARQPRRCHDRTMRLRKLLRGRFATPTLFSTDNVPTAVEISTTKTRRTGVMHTVAYGIPF